MQIIARNISLTDDDFTTLSTALEMYIKDDLKYHKTFESYKILAEEDLNLLNDFVNLGTQLTISKEEPWKWTTYTDAWEWAEATHKNLETNNLLRCQQ